jgi:hypothetical protein
MNKEIEYGLKVKGEIFKVKDMMDECPFEGNELAYLADIEKIEDGEYEISIICNNEGYTYSTADFEEYEIKDVEVVEL